MSETGAGAVLLPYQQRWAADRSPVKVAEKSRRIGLTWGEAADSALEAAATRGQDTWYIGYNKDMALEFIETVASWARAYSAAAGEIEDAGDVLDDVDKEKGVLAYRVRFASGFKVVALSSRPSNLRGKQGRVVLDEFAFHPEPDELLKAAMALLIWGGRVIVISTHNGDDNPFNQLVQDIRAGRKKYSLHRITFDDALGEGLYKRICQRLQREWTQEAETAWRDEIIDYYGDGADEELFCIPKSGSGVYIAGVLIEQRMSDAAPVVRLKQPPEFTERPKEEREKITAEWCEDTLLPLIEVLDPRLLSCIGGDFGRSGDLSVFWPGQIRSDMVRLTPFIVELSNIPFEQQRQILFYICDRLPRFYAGALDARGNGQYLAEVAMQRYGAEHIAQVMLSQEWYRENMPPYKAAFEDGTIVIPKDADVLADHRAIRMERGVAKVPDKARTKSGSGQQRHGDAAIAGALMYCASRMDVTEYDYTPAGRTRSKYDESRAGDDDMRPLVQRGAF